MPILQDIKIEDIGTIIADAVKLSKKSPLYRDFAQEPHLIDEKPPEPKYTKKQDSMSFLLRAVTNVKNSLKKKLKGKPKKTKWHLEFKNITHLV